MKFIYPAVVRKTEDNNYYAFMPDLACCEAFGDSIDDVMDNINEAAYNWIETELEDDDGQLPPISDASDIDILPGDIIRNVCVTMRFHVGWDE
jgi:predicted RNase H-like HicB family nuclease